MAVALRDVARAPTHPVAVDLRVRRGHRRELLGGQEDQRGPQVATAASAVQRREAADVVAVGLLEVLALQNAVAHLLEAAPGGVVQHAPAATVLLVEP